MFKSLFHRDFQLLETWMRHWTETAENAKSPPTPLSIIEALTTELELLADYTQLWGADFN